MAATGRTIRLEQALRDKIGSITDQQVRTLVAAWATAWDEVAPDLTDVLLEMLTAGDQVTRGQLQRSERLRKVLAIIARQLDDLVQNTDAVTKGYLADVIGIAGAAQASIIDSQLPPNAHQLVDLQAWSRVDQRQVAAIVKRSTEQITSRTRPLSAQAYDAVRRELIRGVASGSNPRVTARRIVARSERKFNGGLARALTIARTETLDAYRAAAALGQAQHADVLLGWRWVASLGPRTCPACWAMNGTVHSLEEPGPLGHQNCRCARVPIPRPWSELGSAAEPASTLPDSETAFAAMSQAEQIQVLGRRGWDAWRADRFPISAWARRQTNPGWRDSFVPAKAPLVPAKVLKQTVTAPSVPAPGRVIRPAGLSVKQHELDTAARLASLGHDVEFLANPHNVKSPDFVVLGKEWEAKSPTGVGKEVIIGNLRAADAQGRRAILDLARTTLTVDEVVRQIRAYWARPRANPLEEVWVLPDDVTTHFTLEP